MLKADLRENGLRVPMVVGRQNGRLSIVDGRLRREHYDRSGPAPKLGKDFVIKDFVDDAAVLAFVRSVNAARRQETKSQLACSVVLLSKYDTGSKGGRGKKTVSPRKGFAATFGVSFSMVSRAATLYREDPAAFQRVFDDDESLEAAYNARLQARRRQQREQRAAQQKSAPTPAPTPEPEAADAERAANVDADDDYDDRDPRQVIEHLRRTGRSIAAVRGEDWDAVLDAFLKLLSGIDAMTAETAVEIFGARLLRSEAVPTVRQWVVELIEAQKKRK